MSNLPPAGGLFRDRQQIEESDDDKEYDLPVVRP